MFAHLFLHVCRRSVCLVSSVDPGPELFWPHATVKITNLVIVACCVLGLMGCGGSLRGAPDRLISKSEEFEFLRESYGNHRLAEYYSASGVKKATIRNSIVLGRMYAMDIFYNKFERKLTRERQKVPFLATTASLSLSGTATLVASETTKSILSAIDTGLKGINESYQKDILFQKTIDVLQTAMRSNRNKVRSRILLHLSKTVLEYPLELALSDLEEYFNAGTITGGLIGVTEQAAIKLAATEALKVTTIDRFAPDDATILLRSYWRNGGPKAKDQILDWMKRKGIRVPIAIFINSARYATYRAQLVQHLRSKELL